MTKIYIDAGHGGSDGGAADNGIKEKDINLKIALKTRNFLKEYEGADVKLSREKDQYLSLDQRTNEANSWGADLLLSIHINAAGSSSAHGFESFIHPIVPSSTQAFQNVLHDHIAKVIGLSDRGKKQADFHMLRESDMSAVLSENGFLTNKEEAKKMQDDSWLDKVAKGHADGVAAYLGLKKKPQTRPAADQDPDKLYRVQIGAYSSKENAEKMAEKAKDAGFSVYIYEE